MTEEEKDKAKAAAVAGAGATVGTVGGATAGVLELAARGLATGVTAGAVIGLGAVAGAGLAWGIYRYFKKPRGMRALGLWICFSRTPVNWFTNVFVSSADCPWPVGLGRTIVPVSERDVSTC